MHIMFNRRNIILRKSKRGAIIMFMKHLTIITRDERVIPVDINKVTVGGFKNIKKVEIELGNILSLVSLNSYGKSNVLSAIDFGIDFIRYDEMVKKHMMSWTKGVPLNKQMASEDYFIQLEMSTVIEEKRYKAIYGYQFRWLRDDDTGARIVGEWLKIKLDEKNQKYNSYIIRTEDEAYYRTSESGRCSNKTNIESNELIINKLKAFDFLYYFEMIKRINNISMYIERHLDASSSYDPESFIRTDMEVLHMDNNVNIPRTIFHLKKQFPDKYELLINSFTLLFPQITDIIVEKLERKNIIEANLPNDIPLRIDNQLYFLYVIDSNINQPISFESISDGAKRVFLVLTSILLADINGYAIVAIEEPENSIHPSLLQKYLRVLSQFIVNCKVIVTSHSPYIIQYLEPHNVYVGIPHSNGIAKFSRIRQSAQKTIISDASSLGMSVGDYIFELLSGTDEDLSALEHYLEEPRYE